MAISRKTSQDATGTGSNGTASATYPGATTAGNLLIACCGDNSGGNGETIAGWLAGSLDLAASPGTGGTIFYKIATGSETTVTVNVASGSGIDTEIAIYEYEGFLGTPVLDRTSLGSGVGTTSSTGFTRVTSVNDELAIVLSDYGSTNTFVSWSNGFNSRNNVTNTNNSISSGDKILSSQDQQQSTITVTPGSGFFSCAIATFMDVLSQGGKVAWIKG